MEQSTTNLDLSVVIPVYNDGDILKHTIQESKKYLNSIPYSHELIIVNDGSTDRTQEYIDSFSNEDIQHHSFNKNKGKGSAVRYGMLVARGMYRLFMDADLATPLHTIETCIQRMQEEKLDALIASRRAYGSMIAVSQPFPKMLAGHMGSSLIKLLTPTIRDTQCGFKMLRGDVVETIFPLLTIERWAFDVEILVALIENGCVFDEHPVVWSDSGTSHVKTLDYGRFIKDLYSIWRFKRNGMYKKNNV